MASKVLISVTNKNLGASGGTDYSGAYRLEGIPDLSSVVVYLYAANTGGSSPTLDVSFEYSWDASTWFTSGLAFTQVTTGSANESKAWGSNKIGPFIRVKYVIGGTSTPAYTFTVAISAFAPGAAW